MKISVLSFLTLTFFVVFGLTSCDDDIKSIGGSLQPPNDDITIGSDTLAVLAKTHSLQDSVYSQTNRPVLGNYIDDIFGSIKSDYLCQLYFPENAKMQDNIVSIDTVQFVIDYSSYLGDTISPMGLSVYKVNKALPSYFYTNADPKKYTDMKTPIATQTFSVAGSKILGKSSGIIYREVIAMMDTTFAKDLNKAIKAGTIKDSKTFNEYFPGMYVTTTFGSGTLIQPALTSVDIIYTYKVTQDSIAKATFSLAATTEINQLNHIENTYPQDLFTSSTGMVYAKTPAGVCPEITLPIKKIKEAMKENNYTSINTALFSVWGYTEKEPTGTFAFERPSNLLLINKDSVDYFFKNRFLPNGITTIAASRNTSSNSYQFSNLSRLITIYKDKDLAEDPKFLLIPVDLEYQTVSSYQTILINIYNKMFPTASIYRNNIDNMKLTLVYTKF